MIYISILGLDLTPELFKANEVQALYVQLHVKAFNKSHVYYVILWIYSIISWGLYYGHKFSFVRTVKDFMITDHRALTYMKNVQMNRPTASSTS